MHGYQIMSEIRERSGGVWKPSPGSVYPTLQQLEDEGLIASDDSGGKKVFHLTEAGAGAVSAVAPENAKPWLDVQGRHRSGQGRAAPQHGPGRHRRDADRGVRLRPGQTEAGAEDPRRHPPGSSTGCSPRTTPPRRPNPRREHPRPGPQQNVPMAHGRGTRATQSIRQAGVVHEVIDVGRPDHDDRGYGLQVAEQLGVDPAHVLKTLIAAVDGRPTVAIVPVTGSLDLKALAHVCAGRRAAMTEAPEAERLTGYVVGGISPLGQRRTLPTVLDASAEGHDLVYVSAGRRGLELALAPGDLVALTDALVAPISRAASPA